MERHIGQQTHTCTHTHLIISYLPNVKTWFTGFSKRYTRTCACFFLNYRMAPEVAAVEKKGGYNQKCDIWSLGITSIELAEMQPPMNDLHPFRLVTTPTDTRPHPLPNKLNGRIEAHVMKDGCLHLKLIKFSLLHVQICIELHNCTKFYTIKCYTIKCNHYFVFYFLEHSSC